MEIRRLEPDDAPLLRTIRLRALQDAPEAFGSTYERERELTVDVWRERLESPQQATFAGLDDDGGGLGMATGLREEHDAGVVHLLGMWVDRRARGTGLAGSLVDRVLAWAVAEGCRVVRLWVLDGNEPAERLYLRHGFTRSGRTFDRERDGARMIEMKCPLSRT